MPARNFPIDQQQQHPTRSNRPFLAAVTFSDSYTVHERSPGARVRYAAFCDDVDPEHARAVAAKGAAY